MRRELGGLLEEVRARLNALDVIPTGYQLDIESYKPGPTRFYRIVLRRETDGAVMPLSIWLSYSEAREALRLLVNLLRLARRPEPVPAPA